MKRVFIPKEQMTMPLAALTRPRVVMGLLFFPRGGSAQVVRSLARTLPELGWDVTIICSSLRLPGHLGPHFGR